MVRIKIGVLIFFVFWGIIGIGRVITSEGEKLFVWDKWLGDKNLVFIYGDKSY